MIDAVAVQHVQRRVRSAPSRGPVIVQEIPARFGRKSRETYEQSYHWKASLNLIDQIQQQPGLKYRAEQPALKKGGVRRAPETYHNTGRIYQEIPVRRKHKEPVKPSVRIDKSGKKWTQARLRSLLILCVIAAAAPAVMLIPAPRGENSLVVEADTHIRQRLAAYAGLGAPEPVLRTDEIPLKLIDTFAWETYTVKQGDSVSKIASDHALSLDAVIASNNITHAGRLAVGETLKIPNIDGIPYKVKKGDSLVQISSRMGIPLEAIVDANDIDSEHIAAGMTLFLPGAKMPKEELRSALGERLFVYPVRGRLTSSFGWRDDPITGIRKLHGALDLAAPIGTPVKAAGGGQVAMVGVNASFGKYIILTHKDGFQTLYAHLNTISVKRGEAVSQGAQIGEVGNTGYSTGPHLHFAVFKNNRAVDPLELLTP
ncbi:MAG: peptidoglycan DD-metalloendopeptidase family protein [Treponema sp.]|jgi:murein DD-endopeptidase MepM/ murein hydrolase activator NlpD|nr:peptidoglycan DD-metalloendopeptidase family protein [Treponema sp.]